LSKEVSQPPLREKMNEGAQRSQGKNSKPNRGITFKKPPGQHGKETGPSAQELAELDGALFVLHKSGRAQQTKTFSGARRGKTGRRHAATQQTKPERKTPDYPQESGGGRAAQGQNPNSGGHISSFQGDRPRPNGSGKTNVKKKPANLTNLQE